MSKTYEYKTDCGTYNVKLMFGKYVDNDRTCISLIDAEDGSPVARATVNVIEADLAPDEVIIKNWSENENMLKFLIDNKIVKDTGRRVRCGYIEAPVCHLLQSQEKTDEFYYLTVSYNITNLAMDDKSNMHGPFYDVEERDEAMTKHLQQRDLETEEVINVTKLCVKKGKLVVEGSFLAN